MSKVEIRPLPIQKWHGKSGKDSFTQPITLEVLYDEASGKYATGLSTEEAIKYGELMGVDLTDNFIPNEPHPYYSTKSAQIKLPNHTVIFDDSKPSDFVKIKNLKASRFVANSMKEWEEGFYPDATHVIFDEEVEMESRATKVELKNKAFELSLSMSADAKADLIQILSKKSVVGKSTNFINVEFDDLLTNKPAEIIKFANMDKKELNIRSKVLNAIDKNILNKEGMSIYYMGEKLGNDYEDVVSFFMDSQNSKMKVAILEKLNK